MNWIKAKKKSHVNLKTRISSVKRKRIRATGILSGTSQDRRMARETTGRFDFWPLLSNQPVAGTNGIVEATGVCCSES
jgi:hypothetical protein